MNSTITKLQALLASVPLEETAAPGFDDEGIPPRVLRQDAKYRFMQIELQDAKDKLDRLNFDKYRMALVDCIDNRTMAYQAQSSYTLAMFQQVPLTITSILELIELLRQRLAAYQMDLPNGLSTFYNSSIAVLQERYKRPGRKTISDKLDEPDDEKPDTDSDSDD